MTGMGDETLKKIGLPEAVYDEIIEYRRMRNFGAQRRQLQLIGKKCATWIRPPYVKPLREQPANPAQQ